MNPFKSVYYEWLTEDGEILAGSGNSDFGEIGWVDYPMPPEVGKGGYEALDLAMGLSIVRTSFDFLPQSIGKWLPLLEVKVEFDAPTFQAMTLRGIRGSMKEFYPPAHLAGSQGIDFFRHTSSYCSVFTVDATYSGEVCHVSIARSQLNQFIGEDLADDLLAKLEISHSPAISALPMPLHVSNHLMGAINHKLKGPANKLFCQAQVLEYLAALVHHVCQPDEAPPGLAEKSKERAHALHKQLMTTEGKLPTLDELAQQYAQSARLLNDEFTQEFGKSIHIFVMDQRLQQAHAALLHTDVSIKYVAAQLGYSHVSNFTIAFKRTFGYPPSSLRKK